MHTPQDKVHACIQRAEAIMGRMVLQHNLEGLWQHNHKSLVQVQGGNLLAGTAVGSSDLPLHSPLTLTQAAPAHVEQETQLKQQTTSCPSFRLQPQPQQQLLQPRVNATEGWSIGVSYGDTRSQETSSCPGSDYNDIDLLSKRCVMCPVIVSLHVYGQS